MSDAKPQFLGQIDTLYNGHVMGWAANEDGYPCRVTVLVNDKEVGTALSDQPRADVEKAGKSKGLGGWMLPVEPALEPGFNTITARFPDGTMLTGTLENVAGPDRPKTYRGAVDCGDPPVLTGWSLSDDKEAASVTLEMDDREPLQLPAIEARPDLASGGISNGEGGWRVDVSAMLLPGTNHIRLRFPDGTELPGSPISIYRSASGDSTAVTIGSGSAYRGAIDRNRPPMISGWSLDPAREPVPVTVRINDGAPVTLAADEARPDLVGGGISNGAGGWSLDISESLRPGNNTITLSFPDGSALPGSPILIGENDAVTEVVRYTGAVDIADPAKISGWSVSSTRDGAPVTVTINDRDPVTVSADGPRPDLLASLSSGRGGWEMAVTDWLNPGRNTIRLAFPDGSPFPGSPLTIRLPGGEPEPEVMAVEAPPPAPEAPAQSEPAHTLSLAELDELSIDDLIDVVASGAFDFGTPEPVDEPEEEAPEPAAAPARAPARHGFLARLLGRHRRDA